jgi:DNA-binding IclR family transcriptional regulator
VEAALQQPVPGISMVTLGKRMPKDHKSSQANGYMAPAVHKAFEILRAVAEEKNGLRLVDIAERLGYSKSTTHGLVHTLIREAALLQDDESKQFLLGPQIADLAFSDWNYLKINKIAQPIIDDVRNQVSATVFLGMRIRNRVMITAKSDALEAFRISAPVGTTIPLFAGAVGQVLLAQETAQRIRQLAGHKELPRFTAKSVTDLDQYIENLQSVRFRGYAVDDEAYLSGIRAVAVALNNRRGLPMAIWVVDIASNMDPEKQQLVAEIGAVAVKKLRDQIE